jgi:hypothetical protein
VTHPDAALLAKARAETGGDDVVRCVAAAFEKGHRGTAPPVRADMVFEARGALDLARQIGAAARVLRLVHRCLTGPHIARVDLRGKKTPQRVLDLALPALELRDAMRREGATVVADASGRLHLPVYALVVGYDPHLVEAHVAEGAQVRRTMIRTRATRKKFGLSEDFMEIESWIRQLHILVSWILEDPSSMKVGIITFKPIAGAIREAISGQGDARVQAELRRLPCPPDVLHYGAIRGLDSWKDHDALVTLGDPWSQLSDARLDAALLQVEDWEVRYRALCAAELEQAHGRLRTVHRTKPARALHVGTEAPAGWKGFEEREDAGGRLPKATRKEWGHADRAG